MFRIIEKELTIIYVKFENYIFYISYYDNKIKMSSLRICDVKRDGHCYYRCIYRIAQQSQDVKDAFYIKHIDDEDEAVNKIRLYVSLGLKYEKQSQNILQNLLDIYKEISIISQDYPILKKIDRNDLFENNSKKVQDLIENTNIYASSLEHEIISERLSSQNSSDAYVDIKIIILTRNYNEKIIDLSDKWLRQLQPILKTINNTRLSILINEDNIHYKYAKFDNNIIIDKKKIQAHIEKLIEESYNDKAIAEPIVLYSSNII